MQVACCKQFMSHYIEDTAMVFFKRYRHLCIFNVDIFNFDTTMNFKSQSKPMSFIL